MTYEEIYEKLKSELPSDVYAENAEFLRKEGMKYGEAGNFDGVRAAGKLMGELMPPEQMDEIQRLTHIDGVRLDDFYGRIVQLVQEKNFVDAKPLAEQLYNKIIDGFSEGENALFLSLRNPFEDNLCQHLFPTRKTINRAPFDFGTYLTTYAFIMIECGSTLGAIPILEKAIEFNPVDVGPKFELAEVYKLIKNKKKLIEITQQTLKVASSPDALARCYANMGYMCTDFGEIDDAVCFYSASVMLAPHPAIPYELKGLAQMKGAPLEQPTFEKVKETLDRYDIEFGPDKQVIDVAAALASHYLLEHDVPNALKALKLLYNLTRDEKIKGIILRYEPNAQEVTSNARQVSEGRPNITRTVNENPEE